MFNLKNITLITSLVISTLSLSGCASIVDGESQKITVDTAPTTNANCILKNNKGTWVINSTPGTATIRRSNIPLEIQCQKTGYGNADQFETAKIQPIIFGNILIGGIIGAIIDFSDKAAYGYPAKVSIPMALKQ